MENEAIRTVLEVMLEKLEKKEVEIARLQRELNSQGQISAELSRIIREKEMPHIGDYDKGARERAIKESAVEKAHEAAINYADAVHDGERNDEWERIYRGCFAEQYHKMMGAE